MVEGVGGDEGAREVPGLEPLLQIGDRRGGGGVCRRREGEQLLTQDPVGASGDPVESPRSGPRGGGQTQKYLNRGQPLSRKGEKMAVPTQA